MPFWSKLIDICTELVIHIVFCPKAHLGIRVATLWKMFVTTTSHSKFSIIEYLLTWLPIEKEQWAKRNLVFAVGNYGPYI